MGDHNLFPLKVWFEDEKKGKRLYWNQLETYKKKKRYVCVGQGDIVYSILFS